MLLVGIFLQAVDEFLVLLRSFVPVEYVVGVAPDPQRIVVADRLGGFDRACFAARDEVEFYRVEIAQRLRLLDESDKMPAPQRGEPRLRLLGELGVDERRVVGLAEL